jgi:hypothetical protein
LRRKAFFSSLSFIYSFFLSLALCLTPDMAERIEERGRKALENDCLFGHRGIPRKEGPGDVCGGYVWIYIVP